MVEYLLVYLAIGIIVHLVDITNQVVFDNNYDCCDSIVQLVVTVIIWPLVILIRVAVAIRFKDYRF